MDTYQGVELWLKNIKNSKQGTEPKTCAVVIERLSRFKSIVANFRSQRCCKGGGAASIQITMWIKSI